MPQRESAKALLIVLGDNAESAVLTINAYHPDHLLLFGRQGAESVIEQVIQPRIQKMPKRWDSILAPDPDKFSDCYRLLQGRLAELMPTWQVQPGELVVDCTGGTPSTAMAMALATSDYCKCFVFPAVGDNQRAQPSEAGEPQFSEYNPWDYRATDEARVAAREFNQGRYTEARLLFSRLQERVSGGLKPLYKSLADLSEGYDLWDGFQYQRALERLKGAKKALELSAVWGGPAGLKAVLATLGQNLGFLEKIVMAQRRPDRVAFLDLMANARRRGELARHYEDAMVRLTRALEALAQGQLEKVHGIKTQDLRMEKIPESLREDFSRCFTSNLDGRVKLPLEASFNLLKALGDAMGQAFSDHWAAFKLVLDARNHSILVHGFEPIKPERYQEMFNLVLKLSGVRVEELPRFPKMQL